MRRTSLAPTASWFHVLAVLGLLSACAWLGCGGDDGAGSQTTTSAAGASGAADGGTSSSSGGADDGGGGGGHAGAGGGGAGGHAGVAGGGAAAGGGAGASGGGAGGMGGGGAGTAGTPSAGGSGGNVAGGTSSGGNAGANSGGGGASSTGGSSGQIGTARDVSVTGIQLQRGGAPWNPKGLSLVGALTKGSAVEARKHFGPAELEAAASWGADSLRFQVSQPFLDPADAQHDPAYLGVVKAMVQATLDAGLTPILSMQDQSLAGGNADPTPTAATTRAWKILAPVYAADPRVVLELFNEPDTKADAAGWKIWREGDGAASVGHQTLVDQLRGLGAINVLFADGTQMAEILPATPILSDPLGRLVYAAHPYYLGPPGKEVAQWDARFGKLSGLAPVVVSEWNDYAGGSCNMNAAVLVPELLDYLHAHHIGVFGWAFDLPGTLVADWAWTPTTLAKLACGTANTGGAGELLRASFLMK